MHRALLLGVLFAFGCGGPDIPRLPPLSIGGGGVRLMNEARTPAEAYENAFGQLTGCHNRVRAGLGRDMPRNFLDAAGALEEIAESLRVMRALVVESAQTAYDPYINSYAELASDVSRRRPPANWQTRIDQGEKEIKSRFSYTEAPIVSEWPAGMGTAHEAATSTRPPEVKADPAPPPAPRAPEALPLRLAFKAWKQSHADLVAAFQGGRDPAASYGDVQDAVDAMKKALPAERRAKLDLMLAVYEQQHAETGGFKATPPRGSRELILKQLDVVKETLETEYDPDRK
jgi:hypothetical protein